MLRKQKTLLVLTLSACSMVSFAAQPSLSTSHILVAPTCLIEKVTGNSYKILSTNHSFVLVEGTDATIDAFVAAKNQRSTTPCGGFMDVTANWDKFNATTHSLTNNAAAFLLHYSKPVSTASKKIAYNIKYQTQVEGLLKQINPDATWKDLTALTNFENRYARSENGVKAAEWIKEQVLTMASTAGRTDVTAYFVQTPSYKQPSLVVKVGNGNAAGIVVGGHMDTLDGRMPGADDDGSGSVTVLSVARNILNSGMDFKKPIYFMWYAAEEQGLKGSNSVVSYFKTNKIPVEAVIQFDMTGYAYQNDPTMWLISDYVNKDLTTFIETLINTYVKQPVKYTRCGYACSDHASWYYEGVASAFPFEASFSTDNRYIHSANDTMEKLSLSHINDYAKLGTAFAVELAEPSSK